MNMEARMSSFSLRAADLAAVPLLAVHKTCKGLTPGVMTPEYIEARERCHAAAAESGGAAGGGAAEAGARG